MPQVEWNEKNMKYSLCFFPLIGAVIGGVLIGWYALAGLLAFNAMMTAAGAVCLSVLITGGIHLDGFCDTTDALASHQTIERKLEILKDSSAGAFAVIKACAYFILYFAAFTQVSDTGVKILAVGFILSRSLSGLAVIRFKAAKGSGLAAAFREAAHKRNVSAVLIAGAALSAVGMLCIAPIRGAAAIVAAALTFLYYKRMAYKQFGGITGDLAGYFLVLCELWMCLGTVAAEGVLKLWS